MSSREIFERLGWEPIENILNKREIIMTFKAIQDELPGYMSEMFTFNHNDMYQLRSNDCKLYLGKPNTDFMKKSFSYRGLLHGIIYQIMLSIATMNFP